MNYYAPFYTPMNYAQNMCFSGQNTNPQSMQPNASLPITTSSLPCNNDNSMIWVLGKNEAESYPVAPNCQVVLWDKNAPTLYVKSMSANGVPSMRILDFTERTETAQNTPVINESNLNDKFVTIDNFNTLRLEFEELKVKYDDLMQRSEEKSKTVTKKSKGSDE